MTMIFTSREQLLALTTADGSFFLGTLSKDHCWLRYIAITEQALAHRQHTRHASASAHVAARSAEDAAGSRGSGDVRGRDDGDRHARSSSWSWDLWGKGREVVMAAATAAADALSSPRSSSQQGGGFSRTWPGDHGHSSPAAVNAGQRHRDFGAVGDNRSRDGRATAVEFSAKGGLMAVALVDGTVLLTRVERYTSGVRCVSCSEQVVTSVCFGGWRDFCRLVRVGHLATTNRNQGLVFHTEAPADGISRGRGYGWGAS